MFMPARNEIRQIRPQSQFSTFEVYDPERQQPVIDMMINLADQIIAHQESILSNPHPFPHARWLSFHGEVGTGKTHLIEAMINRILAGAPKLVDKIYLSRNSFYYDNQCGANDYGHCPILIYDDLFSEHQSLDGLCTATDLPAFMKWAAAMYDRRMLIITASNFPLMTGPKTILTRVASVDQVGRALSRTKEMLARSGEWEIVGKDYREELARRSSKGAGFNILAE